MQKYLLVSAMPTPNGGLHLGHLAAQFLPQDIFKRYHKPRGKIVEFYSGFDVYDNAISVAAKKNNVSTYEMAIHYQNIIKDQLSYFNIDIDRLINYLEPELIKKSKHILTSLNKNLSPILFTKNVSYPYSADNTPLSGNWLTGKCKKCHHDTKGYSCDRCGISITPNDIYDFNFEQSYVTQGITWEDKMISFLSVPFSDLENYIESQPISDDIKSLCYVLNQQKNNCYQWTAIDQWGMSLNSEVKDEVFFNRNFTLIEQMIIADIFYENHGENPFSIDSEVKTILAYGKDNVGLLLIDLPSMLLGSKVFEPYRQHWVSHFYCIDGQKMSTSKNFAIWLDDIMTSNISSDSTRAYICSVYSRNEDTNLDLKSLLEHEKFTVDLQQGILSLNKITQKDSGESVLSSRMQSIAEKVDAIFSNVDLDFKEYYNRYKEFCSLIYYVNCQKSAILWVEIFHGYFSALVPNTAFFAKENVRFYAKDSKM